MQEKTRGFIEEFKEFISKGNVLDMAVGVIIATAFGKITTSLVNDVFMPLIGWLIGDIDLTKFNITLSEAVMEGEEVIKEPVAIGIGTLVATVIDFVLVAFIIFLVIKAFNKAKDVAEAKKKAAEEAAVEEAPADPEPSNEEKLLTEIRDLLRKQ